LQALLRKISFDPTRDRLWLVGDLVNRGPRSLEVLRWAREQGDAVVAVLGNHDLHLLALSEGVTERRPSDTLDDVLEASDREALVDWLASRPILHREGEHLLVHAGVPPTWSTEEALSRAGNIEELLRSPQRRALLKACRHPAPSPASGLEDAARDLQWLTRMRMWIPGEGPDFQWKGKPDEARDGRVPWFTAPTPPRDETIVFGHWAALGVMRDENVVALDSGCAWGRTLTAWCVETDAFVSVPHADA